jgi:hypothetical protein
MWLQDMRCLEAGLQILLTVYASDLPQSNQVAVNVTVFGLTLPCNLP